ncbi:MAG: response regulator [Oceanococcus sp.]
MHILIVEEDQSVQSFLGHIFTEMGHTVLLSENGAQAWLDIQNRSADFDLVLLGLLLSSSDGLDILTRMREGGLEIPVAMISERSDSQLIVAALRLRAFDFLIKPINKQQIADLLRRLDVLRNVNFGSRLADAVGVVYQEQLQLTFNSRSSIVKTVVHRISDHLRPFLSVAAIKGDSLALALTESITNAVVHGNLQVSSETKEADWDEFYAQIQERELDPAYAAREVQVIVEVDQGGIGLTVTDQGTGFDFARLVDPVDPVASLGGRGVTLIRYSMDSVEWGDGGRTIKMFKSLAAD